MCSGKEVTVRRVSHACVKAAQGRNGTSGKQGNMEEKEVIFWLEDKGRKDSIRVLARGRGWDRGSRNRESRRRR